MPLATAHLSDEDWSAIDAAFEDHEDPLFGDKPSSEFRKLLKSLIRQVPAPYGLGSA